MKIAWFRASPVDPAARLDDTGDSIDRLRATHQIDVVTAADAHEVVWRHFRNPYDHFVYELSNHATAAFIWPYLFRYPGILAVPGANLHDSRALLLEQQRRISDYVAEFTFNEGHPPRVGGQRLPRGPWPMLRAAMSASRLVVVRDAARAVQLALEYPEAHVRHVPLAADEAPAPRSASAVLRCAVHGAGRVATAVRAGRRAADAGVGIEVSPGPAQGRWTDCDAVLALTWPPAGESLMPAVAAMASGIPVVVLETEASAGWPALDPQTWRPRGASGAPPVVISIDPRDEEHSLMLTLRRLASDPSLGQALATAAHTWWRSHATPAHAVNGWEAVIREAATIAPPPRPAGWPAHLAADGSGGAREVLRQFGVTVDFLR
jgi:hypothetical protein